MCGEKSSWIRLVRIYQRGDAFTSEEREGERRKEEEKDDHGRGGGEQAHRSTHAISFSAEHEDCDSRSRQETPPTVLREQRHLERGIQNDMQKNVRESDEQRVTGERRGRERETVAGRTREKEN